MEMIKITASTSGKEFKSLRVCIDQVRQITLAGGGQQGYCDIHKPSGIYHITWTAEGHNKGGCSLKLESPKGVTWIDGKLPFKDFNMFSQESQDEKVSGHATFKF